jgi:hypothetical protein
VLKISHPNSACVFHCPKVMCLHMSAMVVKFAVTQGTVDWSKGGGGGGGSIVANFQNQEIGTPIYACEIRVSLV